MKIFNLSNSRRVLSIVVVAMLGISMISAKSWADSDHSLNKGEPKRCEKHLKHKSPHGDLSHVLTMLEKDLDLTVEQKSAISNVIEQYNPELQALHTEIRKNRQAGIELMKLDSFDEAAIQQHAKQQASLMERMIVLKSKSKYAIHSQLTDEQKSIIEKKFEQHRMKMNKGNV